MISNFLKKVLSGIFLLTIFIPYSCMAAGMWSVENSSIALPSNLKIKQNVPVGTVLWSSPYVNSGLKDDESNSWYARMSIKLNNNSQTLVSDNIYNTGIDGVGFRFKVALNSANFQNRTVYAPSTTDMSWNPSSQSYAQGVSLELVATSATTRSGRISLPQTVTFMFNCTISGKPFSCYNYWTVRVTGVTNVSSVSCTVGDYNSAVSLGTVYTHKMKSVGSRYNGRYFEINMSCDNASLTPLMTFNGDADLTNSELFKNSGSAKGVAVLIINRFDAKQIIPGKQFKLANPLVIKNTNYKFNAYLYQTQEKVSAGTVETLVNFTLDYSNL